MPSVSGSVSSHEISNNYPHNNEEGANHLFNDAFHGSHYQASESKPLEHTGGLEADIAGVNQKTLVLLLKDKSVIEKLQAIESYQFSEDEPASKLGFQDEVFHVITPAGQRMTVAGQRSADQPEHIHVRIPGTEKLTQFTLKQTGHSKDWNFIYTLPEYHFDSKGELRISSEKESGPESLKISDLFDLDSYSNYFSQDDLKNLVLQNPSAASQRQPVKDASEKSFGFPRRDEVSGVKQHDGASDNEENETLERLQRNSEQLDRHFAKKVGKLSLGGVTAKSPSPAQSTLGEAKPDLLSRGSPVPWSESSDSSDGEEDVSVQYTPGALGLLKKYGIAIDENGRLNGPYSKFHEYSNPRETNRHFTTQGDAVLQSFLGSDASTIRKSSLNPIENVSSAFRDLNNKLYNQDSIHIVSAGAGHTAVGTALYTVFQPNGVFKRRLDPLNGDDVSQPKYKFTFIDPSDSFGGLAYKVGKGCLGGAASSATITNTPVSHLQFGVLGFSFRDFLMQKIATLKKEEANKARADFAFRSGANASALPAVKGGAFNLIDQVRKSAHPTELEKAERLLRINFDPAKANRIDRALQRYRNQPSFKFWQASAKDKPNSQKFWEGQGEREMVCEYDKWVIGKLKDAGVEIEFIQGSVTQCEVDSELNAVYTYTAHNSEGVKEGQQIKGDLGVISIGQGPLRIPPQVKDLAANHKDRILTYDELMPDAQHVADLVASKPGPIADEAVKAYGEKWLGLKIGILGTGIAFEEVEPILAIMTKICQKYEKQRNLQLLPNKPLDFFDTGSFAFSRQGLTHELKREDTFFLRFGFSPSKSGNKTSLAFEKIMTEKEVEYRHRLNEMFKEGATVDVVSEFQKIVDEIKSTPNQTRKEKAVLDACLAFALYKTGNAKAAGLDDLDSKEQDHAWRSDIDVCLLRLNLKFLSYLEKSIVPTSNPNVDRTNRMHKYNRIIAAGYDYALKMSESNKIVLSYKGEANNEVKKGNSWTNWVWAPKVAPQEIKDIDKIMICGGRSNYDKTGRNGGIKFPETGILGDTKDPTLQSMATELGNFPLTPDGKVLPFMMATSAWTPLQALIGSSSLHGYKGTLAAYKDSAKVSLGRAAEIATVAGAIINIKSLDGLLPILVGKRDGLETPAELDTNEFNELVEGMSSTQKV